MPGIFCRLCLEPYKTTSDPKSAITDDFIGRLRNCGITFFNQDYLKETTTVCRNCFNALKHIEKSDPFRIKWRKSTSQKRRHIEIEDTSIDSDNDESQV